jgi:hypothetical protein
MPSQAPFYMNAKNLLMVYHLDGQAVSWKSGVFFSHQSSLIWMVQAA